MADGIVYGARGSGHGKCPRCERGADAHAIHEINPNRHVVSGVLALPTKGRMLGGLIAKPQRGAEIRLLAASGGEVPQQVNQWQIVTMVATDPRGWVDVYGRTFAFPQAVRDRCEGNADRLCSAIKLLHTLGVIYRDRRLEGGYQSIALYEEFPADKEERLDARGRPKGPTDQGSRWRSQGHVGSIAEYGAHSCPACEARIPLFLCDRPID